MEPNANGNGTQLNPADGSQESLEHPGAAGQPGSGDIGQAGTQQVEKLYAGRFKSPEELEEHYKLSSTEGQRLAAEVKRLQDMLRTKPAETAPAAAAQKVGFEGFFDKETEEALVKMIKHFSQSGITEFAKSQKDQEVFARQVSDIWEETKKDYPDVNNPQSELYQLADRLLFENGLATKDDQGLLILATPWAYRIAVETAYAQLSRRSPEKIAAAANKNRATSVGGRASVFTPQTKLSKEQYDALPDDKKDEYDRIQINANIRR